MKNFDISIPEEPLKSLIITDYFSKVETEGLSKPLFQSKHFKTKTLLFEEEEKSSVPSDNSSIKVDNLNKFIMSNAKLLGKGNVGEVFLVHMKEDEKLYALKRLDKSLILKKNLLKYVDTEKNILSMIDHPFIVKMHCTFQSTKKLFMLMDYYPGDMGRELQFRKKFNEEDARFYLSEIVLALEYLHNMKIVYHNLKINNILLDSEGHIRLTNFGVSGNIDKEKNSSFPFSDEISFYYLASFKIVNQDCDREYDWYLLGVLMYELLIGIPPYYIQNRQELIENIQNGCLILVKSLSESCKSLIKSLLCRNPKQRIGAFNDADDIKKHDWFSDFDWEMAQKKMMVPPLLYAERKISIELPKMKMIFTNDQVAEKNSRQSLSASTWFCC